MSAVIDYKRKVYAIRDLPTLPVIAQKVLTVADDDLDGPKKLSTIISSDPALATRILSLANSAYYGHRRKIATINHAVTLIGMNMLKQLSLSAIVCGSVGRGGQNRIEFWRHSFATAIASSLIANHAAVENGDVCFMAGLLHDVGKVIIDTYFPNDPEMDHTEVGACIAERWQLPQLLIDGIAYHHSVAPDHLARPIVACVHAANLGAKQALRDNNQDPIPEVLQALNLTTADFQRIVVELRQRASQIDQFLS